MDDPLLRLGKIGRHVALPGRTILFIEGDPSKAVFVVCKGRLKLTTTSVEDRTMIVRLVGPGDLLGLSAVLTELPYEVTAETTEPCAVTRICRKDFLELVQSDSEIGSKVAQVLAREYRETFLDARRMALSRSAAGRLAQLLLDLAMTTAKGQLKVRYTVALTHEDLANMAGTSRETATRLINRLERDQVISRRGSALVILRRDRLSHLTR
jgi:CRP/FNR family transcriptional regulator